MDPAARSQFAELEAQLQDVYERVEDGDPVAPVELAELVLDNYAGRATLVRAMQTKGWFDDPAEARDTVLSVVDEFVAKFLASILQGRSTYDPDKGPLGHYVHMALHGDVLHEAERHRRRRAAEGPSLDADVEDGAYPWNLPVSEEDHVLDRIDVADRLRPFRETLSPEERECLDLMADEVRKTEPYARILGIEHLPVDQQRRAVNNVKDRIKKRLKRMAKTDEAPAT